jgi:hypothetical protein
MFFYLTPQHTTRIVRIVMKHVLTTAAEVLTVILIFALGALLLAF